MLNAEVDKTEIPKNQILNENFSEKISLEKNDEIPKIIIEKSSKPIGLKPTNSQFSINEYLNKKEEIQPELFEEKSEEHLPNDHFTETDLHQEWNIFLANLQKSDAVVYNAINGFKLIKKSENEIEIFYPSDLSKNEFDKVKEDFINHFKHKVNHYKIEIIFTKDEINLKKEIVTKRSIFEKFAKINPLLKDLDDLMKFDFS